MSKAIVRTFIICLGVSAILLAGLAVQHRQLKQKRLELERIAAARADWNSPLIAGIRTSPLPLAVQHREEGKIHTVWISTEAERHRLLVELKRLPPSALAQWQLLDPAPPAPAGS